MDNLVLWLKEENVPLGTLLYGTAILAILWLTSVATFRGMQFYLKIKQDIDEIRGEYKEKYEVMKEKYEEERQERIKLQTQYELLLLRNKDE